MLTDFRHYFTFGLSSGPVCDKVITKHLELFVTLPCKMFGNLSLTVAMANVLCHPVGFYNDVLFVTRMHV